MNNCIFYINRDTFLKIGIDPQEAIDYILELEAMDLRPVHVRALQYLQQQPAISSS